MTADQAGRVMAILNAAFHRESLERETVMWWTAQIVELENVEAALSVARGFGHNVDRLPSYREFKLAYLAEVERITPQRAAIEAVSESSREIPFWVRRWVAARFLHHKFQREQDLRPFPEQHGYVDPTAQPMPTHEWVEEAGRVSDKDVWGAVRA